MKRTMQIGTLVFILALASMACNLPGSTIGGSTPVATPTPTLPLVITATLPPLTAVTPTLASNQPPTNTPTSAVNGNSPGCTYKVTFVNDVTVPDGSTLAAGQVFVKTWRVRNDGTCTWGPNQALRVLAFTGGSQLGASDQVALPAQVGAGQTVDVSVTLKAPAQSGSYVSQWMFRLADGTYIGLGAKANEPLYTSFLVGSSSSIGQTPTRLNFEAGATAIAVDGTLQAGQLQGYVLTAMKDQMILVMVASPANNVNVKITAADNTALGGSANTNTVSASALLPSTQDYTVWVTGGAAQTTFSLSIVIPSRITFDPGATSASVDGTIRKHAIVDYILRAQAGQTLTVKLSGDNVGLTIYGLQDGSPLVRAASGANSYAGKLTRTQEYILSIVPTVDSTTFTVAVTVQ